MMYLKNIIYNNLGPSKYNHNILYINKYNKMVSLKLILNHCLIKCLIKFN